MKVLINLVKKIFNIVFLLLSPVRRLICRRRRHSDTPILPLTTTFPTPPAVPILPPTNETELQSWDSWGLDESQGRNRVKQESPQPEPEIDFFQGMTPTIKKTTKILIKKKDMDNSDNSSNRLAMNSEFPVSEQELGVWEEALPSWEEASEDLTWQADATIKEKKRAEREARQMEQQRRKIEKESLRAIKKECTFSAVRLS